MSRWDDWVAEDRLRKLNDENKELAANLQKDFKRAQREEKDAKKPPPTISNSKRKSVLGSDLGSFRASEERTSGAQAPRGTKRARDWEIEKASTPLQAGFASTTPSTTSRLALGSKAKTRLSFRLQEQHSRAVLLSYR